MENSQEMENSKISEVNLNQPKNQSKRSKINSFFSDLFKDFKASDIPKQIKQGFLDLKQDIKTEFTREEFKKTVDQLKSNVNIGLARMMQGLSSSQIIEYNEIKENNNPNGQNGISISVISTEATLAKQKNLETSNDQNYDSQLEAVQTQFGETTQAPDKLQSNENESPEQEESLWIPEGSEELENERESEKIS